MYFKFFISVLVVWMFIPLYAFSQSRLDNELIVENLIEQLTEELDEEVDEEPDFSEIASRLTYYLRNPIDLNKTDERELQELYFLSTLQIQELLRYRQISGRFISIYELQSIKGFDEYSIQRILPFVHIQDNVTWSKPEPTDIKHDLIFRYGRILERQKGYLTPEKPGQSHYIGSPDRLFVRYRYRLGDKVQASINMKKDAGEQFFNGEQRNGFDFYSASVLIKEVGKMQNLVIGDYSLQVGQGVSLWNGFSMGKGSFIQNIARQEFGLRSYTSSNESQYLRGVATTVKFNNISIIPFFSYKKLDAPLSNDSSSFSSVAVSGYRRTPAEIRNRSSVTNMLYGVNLLYNSGNLKIGATTFKTSFDKPMIPNQQLYNQYAYSGKSLVNSSIYYHYTLRNVYFFGEEAHSSNGGFGTVNGLIASLSHGLSLALLHRYYQKDFYSFVGQGFSENSKTTNERGLYTGLIWNPNRKFEWVTYADYFKFAWVKYRVDGPSQGYDLFSKLTFSPRKTLNFLFQYRYRNKEENAVLEHSVNKLEHVVRHQVRIEGKYKINDAIQFRNRFDFLNYSKGPLITERGYLFYHDVLFKPQRTFISGNIRLAVFKTDSYNSRIYAFENDVLYGYSFPAYYNKGIRMYSNVRLRLQRNLDLWMRYAAFLYSDKGIGSALNYIEGSMKSDIRVQLRIQF